jgi:hypothetical protein
VPITCKSHCKPTPTAQREAFQEEAFNQHASFFSVDRILWRQHEGPTTHLAAVILFARLNMPIPVLPA